MKRIDRNKLVFVIGMLLVYYTLFTLIMMKPDPFAPAKPDLRFLMPPTNTFHIKPRRTGMVKQAATPERILPFIYPPNASNYVWAIQTSTNLVNWITLVDGMIWPPSTNGDIITRATNGNRFYRMWGHN